MSIGMQVAMLVIGGIAVWIIVRYYWLRILACAGLLVIWGVVGVLVPLYMAVEAFQYGQPDKSLLTLLVLGITGGLWVIAFMQAREWFRRTRRVGFFKKRWNAR